MKPFRKLEHEEQQQTEQESASSQQQNVREFRSAEEMLRHDVEQMAVPSEIGARLRESIAKEPPPPRSWWQRMFGK
ncbi:MAG TPA: hypothetical protein VNT99_20915 [Methylomirabilota bacterium]|nr:hypothetical protein [Methylomirabilota bacterium]